MKTKILFISILFFSKVLFGQDYSKHKIPCEKVVYPIHYYHVLSPHFVNPKDTTSLNIDSLIVGLNYYFSKICIEFTLCKVDTIRDYNYYYQEDDPNANEEFDLVAMNYDPFAINVYRVIDTNKESYLGICYSKADRPHIFVSYSDGTNISINTMYLFTRQFYRYFGLPYTNSLDNSKEWVNTLNYQTKADSIWDTPADPFLLTGGFNDTLVYPGSVPIFEYYYSNRKDTNGDYYIPLMYNLMSISKVKMADRCDILTHEQYQRLIFNERRCRKKFWDLE